MLSRLLLISSSSSLGVKPLAPTLRDRSFCMQAQAEPSGSSPFGRVRRVVTGHLVAKQPDTGDGERWTATPSASASGVEPSVTLAFDDQSTVDPIPSLPGAFTTSLWATSQSPATNVDDGSDVRQDGAALAAGRLVVPGGSNLRVTDLEPNVYVGMHRSSSIDYNIVTHGSVYLIVPRHRQRPSAEEEEDAKEDFEVHETLCKAGEVVIQRGTLHAWRAGPQGVRWITVILDAEPVRLAGRTLPDVAL